MISWIGFKYVEAEMPRESNEELLNSLKEGVFIVDATTSEVRFKNIAARRINRKLRNHGQVPDASG